MQSAAPLWWKDAIFWNRTAAGHRQLIVNLINPPKVDAVEENPRSEINPPVRDIRVSCAPDAGKAPRAAYLLTAEPLEPGGEPATRCVPLELQRAADGNVTVTVPSVIFWKMVVFEY